MKVYIIGIGPGTEDYLLPAARRELERADCLVGARRLISLFRTLGKEEVLIEGHFNEAISYIKRYKDKKKIAVLVSGDPGMYSLLDKVSRVLKKEEYVVIPGISTVQLAFARLGEGWHDAKIISLHGRKIDNLAGEVRAATKVFLLTDPDFPPDKIASRLIREGLEDRRVVVLENLSYPNERIVDTSPKRLKTMKGWKALSAMIIESQKGKDPKGRLYGIGIGPGDPGLITLRAAEVLNQVDTIFTPKGNEDGESFARSIIEKVISGQKDFVDLTFPMTKDKKILNRYWRLAAGKIAKEVVNGKQVAFVTIGDPFIYSTYIYLLKTLERDFPEIDVETIPGISAFNAAASRAGFPLAEGDERLAILPVTKNLGGLREAFKKFDTVVLMKVGSKLDKVARLLKELKLIKKAVLVSHAGLKNEKIIHNLASLKDKKAGYLSIIIVRSKRE